MEFRFGWREIPPYSMGKRAIFDALSFPQSGAKQWWEGTRVQSDGVTEGTHRCCSYCSFWWTRERISTLRGWACVLLTRWAGCRLDFSPHYSLGCAHSSNKPPPLNNSGLWSWRCSDNEGEQDWFGYSLINTEEWVCSQLTFALCQLCHENERSKKITIKLPSE